MLGLGLGMVMQVLVLAVQNAVDRSVMGVATSGSTMFRQIGGSIGVALFGTIFASRVHVELAHRLPAGTRVPKTINPEGIKHLPPTAHVAFQDAFAAALHPVFLTAAGDLGARVRAHVVPPRGAAEGRRAARRGHDAAGRSRVGRRVTKRSARAISRECYIGQAAVDQQIIGAGFLGEFAPSPGRGLIPPTRHAGLPSPRTKG